MKRLISFLLCTFALVAISGCNTYTETTNNLEYNKDIVVLPDEQVKKTINGYVKFPQSNKIIIEEVKPTTVTYVGNKNSKKFHNTSCKHASSIKKSNLIKFSNKNEAVTSGYQPCAVCKP
jgi:hypothetical protein